MHYDFLTPSLFGSRGPSAMSDEMLSGLVESTGNSGITVETPDGVKYYEYEEYESAVSAQTYTSSYNLMHKFFDLIPFK